MKNLITNLLCVITAVVIAYYLASPIQNLYCNSVGSCTGGFFGFDLSVLAWMVLLFVSVVTFLLTILGGRHKYVWIALMLIPIILLAGFVDLSHVYFPIILGLFAWLLGIIVIKTLTKLAPGFMAKIA